MTPIVPGNANSWRVFTTCPRERDVTSSVGRMRRTISLTGAVGFAGTLFYTGNDVPTEPWLAAAEMARDFPTLSPFVAVNPVYMHPFTVARCIATLANVYGTRCYVNLVAGTSLSDLMALDEADAHDDRYARVREFAIIVKGLCAGKHAISLDGRYFGARNLLLPTCIPDCLQPVFVVAGQSPAAVEVAQTIGAHSLGMLQPSFKVRPVSATGVHMAIVARESDQKARDAAHVLYPNQGGATRQMQLARNTDANWKKNLLRDALGRSDGDSPYWLGPFNRGQLDCPLLVGSIDTITGCLRQIAADGVSLFVLELPDAREDFEAAAAAIHAARTETIRNEAQK